MVEGVPSSVRVDGFAPHTQHVNLRIVRKFGSLWSRVSGFGVQCLVYRVERVSESESACRVRAFACLSESKFVCVREVMANSNECRVGAE